MTERKVRITLDGDAVEAEEGTTVLEVARSLGRSVPTICYHEATTANAVCRICVVDVRGQRLLQPACVLKAADGMDISTRGERVERARRTILEMLSSTMDLSEADEIIGMMQEHGAHADRFPEARRRETPLIDDNPMYVRDYSKCLLCWRCVQVCAEDAQYTFALSFDGRGYDTQIGTFFDRAIPQTTCVLCGQCVAVCPTGALKSKREHLLESGLTPAEVTTQATGRRRRGTRGQPGTRAGSRRGAQ